MTIIRHFSNKQRQINKQKLKSQEFLFLASTASQLTDDYLNWISFFMKPAWSLKNSLMPRLCQSSDFQLLLGVFSNQPINRYPNRILSFLSTDRKLNWDMGIPHLRLLFPQIYSIYTNLH